jgi:nucleotide-binding universal stress UspA family protein
MKNHLVTVMKFTKLWALRFVKEKLEFEGIECFLTDEGFERTDLSLPLGWNLKVMSNDVERTVRLLLQLTKTYDLDNIEENDTIKNLKKLMVPVDLESYSFNLCQFAFTIAEKINAEIKFLYVLEDPSFSDAVRFTTSWERHLLMDKEEAYRKANARLVKFRDELKTHIPEKLLSKVKFHFAMHTGKCGNTIVELSTRYKPEMVIMGLKDKDSTDNEHVAKLTQYVIEHIEYPVMTIPSEARITDLSKIKVMYATDFNDRDNSSLNKLLEIMKPFEPLIHCIHVDTERNPVNQERMDEITQLLHKDYSAYRIHADLFDSVDLSMGIEEFVEKNEIELISLTAQKRSFIYKIFHPDILQKMILSSKIPMLVFPIQ